jgi:hypothetical protein
MVREGGQHQLRLHPIEYRPSEVTRLDGSRAEGSSRSSTDKVRREQHRLSPREGPNESCVGVSGLSVRRG